MNNKRATKRALLTSVMALVMCVVMLVGTTFAWFTDTASTGVNKIVSGNLDIELQYATAWDAETGAPTVWDKAEGKVLNFRTADNRTDNILWEPGATYQLPELRIVNNGNLALKYKIVISGAKDANPDNGKDDLKLLDVIDWKYKIKGDTYVLGDERPLAAKGVTDENYEKFDIQGTMRTTAGNEYQGLSIEGISITVYATQYTHEYDSFNNTYDENAEYLAWDGSKDEEGLGNNTNSTEKTVTIASAEQLAAFAEAVNAGNSYAGYTVTLDANIDLLGTEWTPIGMSGKPFSGTFDGNGKTISNLYINKARKSDVGLFGLTTNGEVKNLTVHNATVKGYLDVGAIAGTPYTSKYTNIKLTGEVKVEGFAYVGGMFGKNAYANLTNLTINASETSYVKAESEDYRTYVGGIVGFMGEGGHKVTNAVSNIDVIGSTCDVGGITGIAHYGNSFINCSSSGNVTLTGANDAGDELEIGGIAGVWYNEAGQTVTFENCSYTGTLSSYNKGTNTKVTEFSNNGLVGRAYNTSGTGTLIIN